MNPRRRSRIESSAAFGPVLLVVGMLAAACDASSRAESPEESLERTLIELRRIEERQRAEAEPDSRPEPGAAEPRRSEVPTAGRTSDGPPASPIYTPYEVAPAIANRLEVQRALAVEYPPVLRDAGIGGTTLVHMYINVAGVVGNALVAATSGYEQLDQAALRVAAAFEFEPAQNEGENVAAWLQVPITFQASR
ncbi:MAG: energy transducer TonB [Gemmatimonadota bacterium]|nr:energy transducer TonB [Gemmatimonadota bacterium]